MVSSKKLKKFLKGTKVLKNRFDILGVKKKFLHRTYINTMEGATRTLVSKVDGSTRKETKA